MKCFPAILGIIIAVFFIRYPAISTAQPYSQYVLQPEQQFYDVTYYGIAIDIDVNSNSIREKRVPGATAMYSF